MAKYVGKDLLVSFAGTALEAEFKKLSTTEDSDLVDCSAGSDTNHDYLPTLKDGSADLDLLEVAGTAGTALWAAVAPGASGTFQWKPNGTITHTVANAYVKSRKRDIPFDDCVAISVSFQFASAVT